MFSSPIRMNGLGTFRWQPDTVSEQSPSLNCLGWHCLSLTCVTSHSLCTTLPLKELHSSYKSISCVKTVISLINFFSVGGVANFHMLLFHRGKNKIHAIAALRPASFVSSTAAAYPETNVAQPSALWGMQQILSSIIISSLLPLSVHCARPAFRVIKTWCKSSTNWVV